MRAHVLAAAALFAVAFAVRWWLRQGLVLGDDPQEYAALLHILSNGPLLQDQLHVRFGGWIFNHLAFWLFGVSETAFLVPTMLVTSTFGVLAYALFVRWRYGLLAAFLGGLLVALAPFELVLGSLRANDSYLEMALAFGFAGLVLLEERPVWQGIALAVCIWFGFYVKLWVVYALPALGLYYLVGRRWRAATAFTVASIAIHGLTCAFWKYKTGSFTPFISIHAANYPVPLSGLLDLFWKYPRLMLVGSFEFPITLWGAVPYVLLVVLAVKLLGTVLRRFPASLRLDRGDLLLLGFWGSFFLLLEFFPNGFQLDAYYSVPRIFRYLAPISFPIALHAAKCALAVGRVRIARLPSAAVGTTIAAGLVALYVSQAVEATGPSHIYRSSLHAMLRDVVAMNPPTFIAEAVVASYVRDLYLDPTKQETEVVILGEQHNAPDYEKWLHANQWRLRNGTLLLTGLASFIHYGAHIDGPRLAWFNAPLPPEWKLVREYDMLTYLPRPERARLWRLEKPQAAEVVVHDVREDLSAIRDVVDPVTLFASGMRRYDANDYPGARPYYRKLLATATPQSEDAAFFYAATFFREANWLRARHEFKRLAHRFPSSRWLPAAYWHIATCDKNLGHNGRSHRMFALIVRRFPKDPQTVSMARQALDSFDRRRRGVLVDWFRSARNFISGRA
jgi:tetratricopeptide (TPR) repeat protein